MRLVSTTHGAAAAIAAAVLLLATMAAPVHAQRLSLAQRVTRLEKAQQQLRDAKQNNLMLVNQVQDLQSQTRQLEGQIEELQHRLKQLQQTSKDQYIDLDSRLRRLENKAPAGASTAQAPASSATVASGQPAGSASAQVPASSSSTPSPADAQAAQTAYNRAFTALRNGQFVQSARLFRGFIQQYPQSKLLPNAYYWLGESYYTVQNYDVALKAFQHLLKLYPDSDKAPGALLKTGYCQDVLKQEAAAQKTLHAVITKYPGSTVAQLAQQRLQDIALRQAD